MSIMTLGGIIREWEVAASSGEAVNIILGYPHAHSYLKDTAYHGAITGRYCNRIANSQFFIDDKSVTLIANEGKQHLHGGPDGFNRRHWNVEEQSEQRVVLSLFSPDGDQGYPGNLQVTVHYELDNTGSLNIDWQAESDADTVISLTSHGYFNLAGSGDTLEHYLRILAPHYTPVNSDLIPSGEIRSVAGTALDLQCFTRLGDILASHDPEIQTCDGLDHNWAGGAPGELRLRAELLSAKTNLLLRVCSTLPGLQCYSGNHLQANGIHGCHEGICLEPQYYPDSPNQPSFPSPLLRAGETKSHRIQYQVSEVDPDTLLYQR